MAADLYICVIDPDIISLDDLGEYRRTYSKERKDELYDIISDQSETLHLGELSFPFGPFDDLESSFDLGDIVNDRTIERVRSDYGRFYRTPPEELISFLEKHRDKIMFTFVW